MLAIIPHHCGNHDLCLDCNFRIFQQEHPTESVDTYKDLYAQSSRYYGWIMSLNIKFIETLTEVVMKNEKNEFHGKHLIDQMKMRSILGNVRKFLQKYQTRINDKEKRNMFWFFCWIIMKLQSRHKSWLPQWWGMIANKQSTHSFFLFFIDVWLTFFQTLPYVSHNCSDSHCIKKIFTT